MEVKDKNITLKEVSKILNVSEATVKNWIKQGLIKPIKDKNFSLKKIDDFYKNIKNGSLKKLRSRANKKNLKNLFIPKEYIEDNLFISEILEIKEIFIFQKLDIELTIITIILKFLILMEEVLLDNSNNIFNIDKFYNWKRNCIKNEIYSWVKKVKIPKKILGYKKIFETFNNIKCVDSIGIIYQSIIFEGYKSKNGSYYTPTEIVNNIFKNIELKNKKILDPCCGTGKFLICSAEKIKNPKKIYGFDIDNIAVKISRINLMVLFKDREFNPNIYNKDFLLTNIKEKFDVIATNPPWGSLLELNISNDIILSKERYSYFLVKSIELLKTNGKSSFILPDSILNIKVHLDIREYLLNNITITSIYYFNRIFKNVFSKVIRMDILNKKAFDKHKIKIIKDNENYSIYQKRFKTNKNYIFDIFLKEEEYKLLEYLYLIKHKTLKNNAKWGLGIVTGNNEKYILKRKIKDSEFIIKGNNIEKFKIKKTCNYIKFTPYKFQQTAKEKLYRAKEKLIYRFISNKLKFAYDNKQYLTLNSANILIPEIKGFSIKYILALLNSKLFQFIFKKKFNTHKILKSDLEQLPLFDLKDSIKEKIEILSEKAINGENTLNEIDEILLNNLGLTEEQKKIICF